MFNLLDCWTITLWWSISFYLHSHHPFPKKPKPPSPSIRSCRSPTWIIPISQFVDQNCLVFEDQEVGSVTPNQFGDWDGPRVTVGQENKRGAPEMVKGSWPTHLGFCVFLYQVAGKTYLFQYWGKTMKNEVVFSWWVGNHALFVGKFSTSTGRNDIDISRETQIASGEWHWGWNIPSSTTLSNS